MRVHVLVTLAFVGTALAGCISATDETGPVSNPDEGPMTYVVPETITGLEEVMQMEFVLDGGDPVDQSTAGIRFHDGLMYTSGTNMVIVDVSDPTAPVTLAILEDSPSRDVDIMEHPNGNLYAVLAGSPGIVLVDVTDPTTPTKASEVALGFHNIATVPGTALVYNSRSLYREPDVATEGGLVDIVDFTDIENPTVTPWRMGKTVMTVSGPKTPTAPACHDIAVYVEANRAYCAGVTETQIWDISDPTQPIIEQIVLNPGTNIHHAAYAARDHNLLIIGDELGGAAFAPGCTVPNQAYGGVWFVDISDLSDPTPVGFWAPDEPMPGSASCTAHFGNFVEDRDVMVMSFYRAGVFLVDFSDETMPVEIANYRPGGSAWEAFYYRGQVYTGDTVRGVDILNILGDGEVVYEIMGDH